MRMSIQLTVIAPVGNYCRPRDLAVEIQCQSFDSLSAVKSDAPRSLVDGFGNLHQEREWCSGL